MAPKEFTDLYPPERIRIPENFMPAHPFNNGEMFVRDENLAPFPRTPEIVQDHISAYYAMITHLDAQVGRVLDALEKTGRTEDTVVIFTGDNGLAVGQHGLLGKQNLYEHSVRVPLIICGPEIPEDMKQLLFGSGARWWARVANVANILAPVCLIIGIIGDAIDRVPGLQPINWLILAAALWIAGLSAWMIAYHAAKEGQT